MPSSFISALIQTEMLPHPLSTAVTYVVEPKHLQTVTANGPPGNSVTMHTVTIFVLVGHEKISF